MKTTLLPIDDLLADERNARLHPGANLIAIKASLKRFGQMKPIVVQRDGMVVRAGNGTLAAAIGLDWTTIACHVVDLSDEDAVAYGIADNRAGELAEWDDDVLRELVAVMDDDLVQSIGFSDDERRLLMGEPPPSTERATSTPSGSRPTSADSTPRVGDVWHLGAHRLVIGDASEAASLLVDYWESATGGVARLVRDAHVGDTPDGELADLLE